MTRIIIHGCNGKMGKTVASMASEDENVQVVAGVDISGTNEYGFPVYPSLGEIKEEADCIIDFSLPWLVSGVIKYAVDKSMPAVIATTGLSEEDLNLIDECAKEIPVLQAFNMSLGMNLLAELVKSAAKVLGDKYDIEIIEAHHNKKIDSPSGSAYMLADQINSVLDNSKNYVFGRHSKNERRTQEEIGIHAVRGGTIPGKHTVMFAGEDEVVEIQHTAYSKRGFASGAINAAKFLSSAKCGRYNMHDVINSL